MAQIKAYFVINGKTEEIRRFYLDIIRFEGLKAKVKELCPVIQDDSFVITWKDSDDDHVTISRDYELEIALRERPDIDIMKVYVTKNTPKTTYGSCAEGAPAGQHVGVVCDGCNKEIYGFRYKCLQCPDYDLCKDCEGNCFHPEHFMIRIPIPLQWKSYYGKKVSHLLNKFMRKASSCPVAEEVTAEFGRSMKKENHPVPWWLDTCSAYLSDFTNLTNGILLPESKNKPAADEKEQSEQKQKKQDATKASPSTSKTYPEEKRLEFLKTFSENISQFLDPLGIDINVQMKAEKPNQPTKDDSEKNEPAENTNISPFNVVQNESGVNKPKEYNESSRKEDSGSIASGSSTGHVSQSNDASKNDEWTLLDSENIPSSAADSSQNTVPTLNNPNLQAGDKTASPTNLYPTLSTDINTFWHKDIKVQNAVVTMMKMGFTNEGGWLTKLLISTGGDINKAMDLITGSQ